MIDPKLHAFLESTIDSPVKLHLVLLFSSNPQMSANASHLAERACRDIWSVAEALRELQAAGLLALVNEHGRDSTASPTHQRYCYLPRTEFVPILARLMTYYDDPFARDQIQRIVREAATMAPYRRTVIASEGSFVGF